MAQNANATSHPSANPPTSPPSQNIITRLDHSTKGFLTRKSTMTFVRVKGRKRLYKFRKGRPAPLHTQQQQQTVVPTPLLPQHRLPQGIASSHNTVPDSSQDGDLLLHSSGLTIAIPTLRGRKGSRNPKNLLKTRGRKTSVTVPRLQKVKTALIYNKGTLEAFGFIANGPRNGFLVQASTREAEAKLSEFSGTFVSTVP